MNTSERSSWGINAYRTESVWLIGHEYWGASIHCEEECFWSDSRMRAIEEKPEKIEVCNQMTHFFIFVEKCIQGTEGG